MSLGDIQQVYSYLMEIERLLGDIEAKTSTLQANASKIEKAAVSARKYYKALTDINHILSHLGVGNLDAAIAKLQKAMFVVMALNAAMNTMLLGPAGIILGGLTVAATIVSVASPMEGY